VRVIVYGAGGIGGPLGAYLWRAGIETVLVARGAHLQRIQQAGLTVIAADGTFRSDVPAVAHPSELDPRPDDLIALAMKSQDTEGALRELRDAGWDPERTPILSVQNGIANEPAASRYFARVYGVMIVIPGIHLEPGVVVNPIGGNRGYMDVGRYPRGTDLTAEEFVAAARAAGYAAQLHPDVMAAKGAKFLTNLGNALEAITDSRENLDGYLAPTVAEGEACLRAARLHFEAHDTFWGRVQAHRGTNVELPGIVKRSSSWQSLKRKTGSIETDFLNGEVVLLGRIHGIPTPHNALLQRIAVEMARLGQEPGRYTVDQLTDMAANESPVR
jgi:2-dehydropantoate 2-reductase